MATLVQIYNLALVELGDDRISDPNEDTEAARTMNAHWPIVRDAVLRAHPWNCALKRIALTPVAATPVWGSAYAYNLPTAPDWCLRPWKINEAVHGRTPWVVRGRQIYTDIAGPLFLEFIARIEDTEQLDATLTATLAARLAASTAQKLTSSRTKAADMKQWYADLLREARTMDAQEGTPEEPDESDFITARN
jgi:hypothetical protein